MRQLAIITLIDLNNYGNRLQNFAVKNFFEEFGFEVDTLQLKYEDQCLYKNSIWRKRIRNDKLFLVFYKFKSKLKKEKKVLSEREKNFEIFNKKWISIQVIEAESYKNFSLNEKLLKYDFFVAGSDQIWNPDWAALPEYFLTFAEKNKRMAFAASIGVEKIDHDKEKYFKKALSEMNYISVREQKAAEIIKELLGMEADVFLDPTLLVKKNIWSPLIEDAKVKLPDKYVVSFFLGEEPKEFFSNNKIFEKTNIVYINCEYEKEYYDLSPSEFLYVLKNAQYIYTDSFHAVVFSIIFHKQFLVFERMQNGKTFGFSRLEFLLNKMGLEDRHIDRCEKNIPLEIPEQIFNNIDDIIKDEREKTQKKLKEIFNRICNE